MNSCAPPTSSPRIDWERVTFTTYALSLSFFEAVILDALIRGGARQALILADVEGVRASLSEQGAQRVGKDYDVEPVAVSSGRFPSEDFSLFGPGRMPSAGGLRKPDLRRLGREFRSAGAPASRASPPTRLRTPRTFSSCSNNRQSAPRRATRIAMRRPPICAPSFRASRSPAISASCTTWTGRSRNKSWQPRANLAVRRSSSPPRRSGTRGAAIDRLCAALGLDTVFIHAHAHGVIEGRAGANWPVACSSAVHPVRLDVMTEADEPRCLHAKAFEIICRQGRIVVSGSANATGAALEAGRNVEACVMRLQRDRRRPGPSFRPKRRTRSPHSKPKTSKTSRNAASCAPCSKATRCTAKF